MMRMAMNDPYPFLFHYFLLYLGDRHSRRGVVWLGFYQVPFQGMALLAFC